MSDEKAMLEQKQRALLFGVKRSVIYHVRRRQHFEQLDTLSKIFITVSSIGTVTTLLAQYDTLGKVFGVLTAVLSTVDLVILTGQKARQHADLAQEFLQLEKAMVLVGENLTAKELAEFTAKRLEIEMKEPPALRVLDTICHNDLCRAMGEPKSEFKRVTGLQRFLSPFFDWQLHKTGEDLEVTK